MKTERLFLAILLFSVFCSLSLAQTPSKGVITGRVVSDEGSPLMGITVRLSPPNATQLGQMRSTSTDDEGNFRFNDLSPRTYSIEVQSGRAFVPTPKTAAERAQPSVVRLGESVTLTMIRGGVITGRVTNSNGENLIAMPMQAMMVRDAEGNPIASPSRPAQSGSDDRGIYRFYGLTPGTYIVLANYGNPYFGSQASLYDNEAPTYYPSSTRDTAVEVRVTSGGEATGIDIRYRGERGHAISGKLTGAKDSVTVQLLHVASESPTATAFVSSGTSSFDFYGLPDGDYELFAQTSGETPIAAQPRRVSVRGADVTGVELRMTPLASMAGTIVIESSPNVCDKAARSLLEEMLITARPDVKPRAETDPITRPNSAESAINAKGEFEIRRLNAVRYRLALNLPNENLYVKTMAQKTPAADLARNGTLLKSGDKLTGVTVTLAEGAASVRGKLSFSKEHPSRLRVHLVPTEATAADDLLRYAEKIATSDGSFVFTNLAPGKYFLLARAVPDTEPADHLPSPLAWDATERLKLRKEAEAAKNEIELKACQRVKDYLLRF
ncbi:MAG: collagen binding domain-containing protein [Blastocatellia bacterium]